MIIMKSVKRMMGNQRGWTFIEATIGAVLVSFVVLGFAVTMLAMRESIDRDLSIRVMDQYGSDMMTYFHHALENANQFFPIPSQSSGQLDHFEIKYNDVFSQLTTTDRYRATRTQGIIRNGQRIDPRFPPARVSRNRPFGVLNEGESFRITRFTAEQIWLEGNTLNFGEASLKITLTIRYDREGRQPGDPDYSKVKTYSTVCFMKNKFAQEFE